MGSRPTAGRRLAIRRPSAVREENEQPILELCDFFAKKAGGGFMCPSRYPKTNTLQKYAYQGKIDDFDLSRAIF